MTNFIYNMQDELFHLNMILPVGEFSPITKLVDHIEAQGKQLRDLNKTIEKKNKTIEKCESEKKDLQTRNSYLIKKVQELNEGIRDSEDLTWKQKYDALLHSSEQAISALQKKCQEYKNSEDDATISTIETLVKEKVKHLDARIKELIILCDEEYDKNKKLEGSRNELKKRLNALYREKASKYIQLELVCHKHEETIETLVKENNELKEKIEKLERANLDLGDTIGCYVEEFKKIKEENERIISAKNTRIILLEQELKNAREVNKTFKDSTTRLAEGTYNVNKALEDLNTIINSKNKLLDEYMTKYNNLERNYKEELRTNKILSSTIKCLEVRVADHIRLNNVLRGKLVSIGELANKIDDVILSEE